MKRYYLDTNIILRFLLKDNSVLAGKAREYFQKAKNGKIHLIVISQIIIETHYVLWKFYKLTKEEIFQLLASIIHTPYLDIEDRDIWDTTLHLFHECDVDLMDIFLTVSAHKKNSEVLSFDKDIERLSILLKKIS